jgi:hypothetical protein
VLMKIVRYTSHRSDSGSENRPLHGVDVCSSMYSDEVVYAHVCLEDARVFYALLGENHRRCNCCGLVARHHFLYHGDLPMQVSYPYLLAQDHLHAKACRVGITSRSSQQLQPILHTNNPPKIRPPSHYWKVTVDPQPECINQALSLLVAGTINTLTDFVVVALPIRTVMSVQLSTRQAVPIVLLFAFGFLSCCCGIVRTYYTYKVSTSYDAVWDSYPVWVTAARKQLPRALYSLFG